MITLSDRPEELACIDRLVRARRADLLQKPDRIRREASRRARSYLGREGEELLTALVTPGCAPVTDTLAAALASASCDEPYEFAGVKFGAEEDAPVAGNN